MKRTNVGVGVLDDPQRRKQMKNKNKAPLTRGLSAKLTGGSGITLIALIITIIVMLILAIVSIKVAVDSGLFGNAETAVDQTEIESIKEQLNQAAVAAYNYETGEIPLVDLNTQIGKVYSGISALDAGDGINYKVTIKGKVFTINKTTGKVEYIGLATAATPENPTPQLPEGWDSTKVTLYTDSNSVQVPIPIGYVVSTIEGETEVSGGLVIYEGSISDTSNQYVWIPINNIGDMAVLQTGSTTNYRGVLYDWNTDSTGNTQYSWSANSTGNREPAYLTSSDYGEDNTIGITDELLQTEFNNMVASVEKYEGFYIGRYETGGFNTSQAVVKAGEGSNSINNANWYTMYDKTKTLSTTTTTARIIWGSQYDQMLKFAGCASSTTPTKDSSLIESGAVATDCYKNIYDLCGNVFDWTLEANLTHVRVFRGGYWSSSYSASYRYNIYISTPSCTPYGSRATLYVAL